jgi:hypothetical protein
VENEGGGGDNKRASLGYLYSKGSVCRCLCEWEVDLGRDRNVQGRAARNTHAVMSCIQASRKCQTEGMNVY